MKNPKFIVLLTIVSFLSEAHAQYSFIKTYGGSGHESANDMKITPDKGFIMAGRTTSFGNVPTILDGNAYVVKTDSLGVIEWTIVTGSSTRDDAYNSIILTSDGGYIACGFSYVSINNSNILVTKINAAGTIQWQQVYGGASYDTGYEIIELSTGDYVIAAGSSDFNLMKISSTGSVIWGVLLNVFTINDLTETYDGGIAVTGIFDNGGVSIANIFIAKLGSGGNLLWGNMMDLSGTDSGIGIRETRDSSLIVAANVDGTLSDVDFALLKFTAGGILEWSKKYPLAGIVEHMYNLEIAGDGDYLVSGSSDDGLSLNHGIVAKISPAGDTIRKVTYFGWNLGTIVYSCQQNSDSTFTVSGVIKNTASSGWEAFIMKNDSSEEGFYQFCHSADGTPNFTKANLTFQPPVPAITATTFTPGMPVSSFPTTTGGIVTTICSTVNIDNPEGKDEFTVYPVPFINELNFVPGRYGREYRLRIFDSSGKVIFHTKIRSAFVFNGTRLPAGCYFYIIDCDGNTCKRGRIIRLE